MTPEQFTQLIEVINGVLLFDAPYPDSLSDEEIEALMMQEPINQIYQLPAEEQPIEENEECTYPA